MAKNNIFWLFSVVCFSGLINFAHLEPTEAETREAEKNSASVTFYYMSEKTWEDKKSTFYSLLLKNINDICPNNEELCGLYAWQDDYSFSSEEFEVTGIDTSEKYYLAVTFYLRFNTSVPPAERFITNYVLHGHALDVLLTESREEINDVIGKSVVNINGVKYTPPPNSRLNKIMVPIAFLLLFIVAAVCIGGYMYRRNKQREHAKQLKRERKLKRRQVENGTRTQPSACRGRSVAPMPSNNHPAVDNGHRASQSKHSEPAPPPTYEEQASSAYGQYPVYSNTAIPPVEYDVVHEKRKHKKRKTKHRRRHEENNIGQDEGRENLAMGAGPPLEDGPDLDNPYDQY